MWGDDVNINIYDIGVISNLGDITVMFTKIAVVIYEWRMFYECDIL